MIDSRAPGGVGRASEVLLASLQLGLTSFGGPIAHLGYFERTYVRQRRWLTGQEYAGLVALCQLLPGPTSSQVGFLIGLRRAGWLGALAAWIGFTLPSALLMLACATWLAPAQGPWAVAIVDGLKLVAVAVVAQAVWSMARTMCPDRATSAIALAAACVLLLAGGTLAQLATLGAGAAAGAVLCRHPARPDAALSLPVRPEAAWVALALYLLLLIGLPVLAALFPHSLIALSEIFYRAGALVFGGGHVVLPLLRDPLLAGGWISDDRFLTGYGLAQAIPGPLFTFAAYLGAAGGLGAGPALTAAVAVIAIFLPGLLIAVAGGSLWNQLARHGLARASLTGINAAVVGLLAAALYNPVWVTAVHDGSDAAIAMIGLALLGRWKAPPIAVVGVCVALSGMRTFLR
ncbi:MAG TPA: chromate efflux transporter [Burkholderiaceae bacterium]|nr:chromate efflux transporter [Burkholderiaceae bacterium]